MEWPAATVNPSPDQGGVCIGNASPNEPSLTKVRLRSISDEVCRRLVLELLGVVILLQLRKRSLSGYDVILFVYEKFHVLLSSGTVYSCLYALEREGFVKGQFDSRKRIYKLTESGKHEITQFQNSRAKISTLVLQILNC